MILRRDHQAPIVLAVVVLISLVIPSAGNIAGRNGDKARPKMDVPAIRYPAFLSLEQSRRALAGATSADATARILKAAILGVVREDCELEIKLLPGDKRGQIALNFTMSQRGENSLRETLENALDGLNSLGFRNYNSQRTFDRSKLIYSATLLKRPK